jgi:outer membrane biosynthesis protein TonB
VQSAGATTAAGVRSLDNRSIYVALAVTALVHGVMLGGFLAAGSQTPAFAADEPGQGRTRLCNDRRCPMGPRPFGRRKIDPGPMSELKFLEVDLVPRLGMKPPDPKELPKLIKYEQPEVVQEAVNVIKPPEVQEPPPPQAPLPMPEEVDKKRPKPRNLDDILDAPRDDDPRKRPTALDNIIGSPTGSTYGTDSTGTEVDAVLARLQQEFMKRFVVPSSLSDEELKNLRTKVQITIEANGSVSKYKVVQPSRKTSYDDAVEATVKRFMPVEGGSARLPDIPADIRNLINAQGVIVFDGRRLRR